MSGPRLDKSIQILFVDDHPVVRAGLQSLITAEGGMAVVAEASSGHEAIELYRQLKPDIVLLDLHLPDMPGVEVIRMIRSEFPQARIIVLTSYSDDESISQALRYGVRGYLLKEALYRELIAAIRKVHAGQRSIAPEISSRFLEGMSRERMTGRELQILRQVADGLTNAEIAGDLGISRETVKVHVSNILAKLNAKDRTQAASIAFRRGLVRFD